LHQKHIVFADKKNNNNQNLHFFTVLCRDLCNKKKLHKNENNKYIGNKHKFDEQIFMKRMNSPSFTILLLLLLPLFCVSLSSWCLVFIYFFQCCFHLCCCVNQSRFSMFSVLNLFLIFTCDFPSLDACYHYLGCFQVSWISLYQKIQK